MDRHGARVEKGLLAAILLAGAAFRFWSLDFGLPYPEARPDETTIVMASAGLLFAGMNPHFFHWPSLMFYIVAAIYRLGWEIGHLRGQFELKFDMYKHAAVNAAPYLLVPRVLSAACGTLTIWLVYRLALRLFDRLTATTAAFFVATAFLHVRDSHFGVPDVPMTMLAVAAALPLAALVRDPSLTRQWTIGGILAGLTASTKYNGGLLAASGLAVACIHFFSGDATARRQAVWGLARYIAFSMLAFLCGTPYAVLDAKNFIEGLQFDATHLMEGHGVQLARGWIYHLTFSLWYGMGGPLLMAALAGTIWILVKSWRTAAVVCLFPILYYGVVGRGYTVFVRYITPIVPFLCVAAAVVVVDLTRRIAGSTRAAVAVAVVAILLAIPSLQRVWSFNVLMGEKDTRVLALEWLRANMSDNASIYQAAPATLYAEFGNQKPSQLAAFDVTRKQFLTTDGTVVTPDWITLPLESPLSVYSNVPADVAVIAARDYVVVETIRASRAQEPAGWFDQQDLFFVPYVNFSLRERPGPGIQILKLK